MSDASGIIGIGFLGAIFIGAATLGTDQLVFKTQARSLATELASASAVEGSPDTEAEIYEDLVGYRGRQQFLLMEHMQNASDFRIAREFGMTFWRLQKADNRSTVDLGTSRARRIFDVTKDFLSANIVNTSAVIDNRDPERGPVFIHDGLEQSHFDVTMDYLAEEFGTADNLPQELIVVSYYKRRVGIFVDVGGEELAKSPYADFIDESAWNPSMSKEALDGPGLIERGLGLINRKPD